MNNFLLFMSLDGSVALLLYFATCLLLKGQLSSRHRYRMLKLEMYWTAFHVRQVITPIQIWQMIALFHAFTPMRLMQNIVIQRTNPVAVHTPYIP